MPEATGMPVRGRPDAIVLSVLAMLAVLGAVALGGSFLRHGAVPADAEPSASASAPASASPSAAPRPATVPAAPWRLVRQGGDRATAAMAAAAPDSLR